MLNYELKAHLKHLVLATEDREISWIGTSQERALVAKEIGQYEN